MGSAEQMVASPRVTQFHEGSRLLGQSAVASSASSIALTVNDSLAPLEQEWRRFERSADCTVFQCFDWLAAWQAHVGPRIGIAPAIITGRSERTGELLFILPLAIMRQGIVRRLVFLGRDLCDYNAPLLAPDFPSACADFTALWASICKTLQDDGRFGHDVIALDKMPERVGAQRNPFLSLPVRPHPSGAHATALAPTWDAFYDTKRPSTAKKRDRNKRRRLAELGETRLVTPVIPEDIARTRAVLIAQKSASLARLGVEDIFRRPGYLEFFRAVSEAAPNGDLAHISHLQVGEEMAATNFGLCFRGTYYHVLTSYDDGPTSRYGAGGVHLQELMAYAIGRGCTNFDMTIGDEPYKLDWSDTEIRLYDLIASSTLRGSVVAAALDAGRVLKRSIKQSSLWPFLKRLRARLARRTA